MIIDDLGLFYKFKDNTKPIQNNITHATNKFFIFINSIK